MKCSLRVLDVSIFGDFRGQGLLGTGMGIYISIHQLYGSGKREERERDREEGREGREGREGETGRKGEEGERLREEYHLTSHVSEVKYILGVVSWE